MHRRNDSSIQARPFHVTGDWQQWRCLIEICLDDIPKGAALGALLASSRRAESHLFSLHARHTGRARRFCGPIFVFLLAGGR